MAKFSIQGGATSESVNLFIQDSSSTTGAGLTGLVYNSAGLTCYYNSRRGNATAVTLATLANPDSAWSSGGFKEISSTNMPGMYRFDIPNAALVSGGSPAVGRYVTFMLKGATNMAPCVFELELTATNNQDSVRGGMTALPNAAAEAAGGLYTRGTGAGQIQQPANGYILTRLDSPVKRNTALSAFGFTMRDSSGVLKTGLTVSGFRSIDGAAFAATATATATEVANGFYKLDLAAADLNGTVIDLRFTATGAQDTTVTLLTMP